MKRTIATIASAAALTLGTAVGAQAADTDELSPEVESELTPEQREALEAEPRTGGGPVDASSMSYETDMAPAATYHSRTWFERGSALMGTTDTIEWSYDGSSISASSGYQTAQWVFPNIARNEGITRYNSTSDQHRWRAVNVIGAGVPTPWGDVKVYETTYTHYGDVYGNGNWNWDG